MTPHFSELETERLVLRRLKPSDWEMISYLRSDEVVNRYVNRPPAESKEKALEFIAKIDDGINNRVSWYWVITEKNNDKMIGSICLWNLSEDRKAAEVGYDLSPEFHGKGIMNESLQSVLAFGFNVQNLDLIEAYTHADNESSRRLLERNGFTIVEGKKDEYDEMNVVYSLRKVDSPK
ncbi:MAG: GNAT family N-acetyltransferase [Flavobacteriales bacterium]|nr:GNAT family N-acetyltransferase [Flavobacteriales bacterium]